MFEDSVFCLLKRENVPVLWTPLPRYEGHASIPDGAVPVCLGFGKDCGGERCVTFQVALRVMAAWLARSGNGPGRLPIRRARCSLCGVEGELQEVDAASGYCPRCRAVAPFATAPAPKAE